MPVLYIIAGCNGAGKTTASKTILPTILDCTEFVNADEIARGLSPFNPEGVAVKAGRLMLERIDELIEKQETFAIETTLATRSYAKLVEEVQAKGYTVVLIYFWLNSYDLAKERVSNRVKAGGHNIPDEVVERRYTLGIQNLCKIFIGVVDEWLVYDNSDNKALPIANGYIGEQPEIINPYIWNVIQGYDS